MSPDHEQGRMFSIEQSLIGILLTFEGTADEVVPDLYPSHFVTPRLREIYEVIRAMVASGEALSPTSVVAVT